jgi:hypothetical protein
VIYITKFSIFLSFIYRYSQMFSEVSSCHAADVPSLSDFVPNPTNHVQIYGRKRFCCPCPQFFQTCKKRWNKTLSLTLPPHRNAQGCYIRQTWWPSYRSTIPNPSNHRAIEVGRFLSSSAQIECHLAVCMKTSGLGAIFETYLTKLLLLVQKLRHQIFE